MANDLRLNKFDTNELLTDGKPFCPVPRFFFRLWRLGPAYEIPQSFWTTLLFIMEATIGSSAEGIKGSLAQSQIPVDHKESAKWIAAMDARGLIKVTYSNPQRPVASKFEWNPEITEEEWWGFVFTLGMACHQGLFSRDSSVEQVRKAFKAKEPKNNFPLWSLMLWRWVADEESKFYNATKDIDVLDEKNWIVRGFDVSKMHATRDPLTFIPEFKGISLGAYTAVQMLFHTLWTRTDAESDRPLMLASDFPEWIEFFEKEWGKLDPGDVENIRSMLIEVQEDETGDACLECPWLTYQWRTAKFDADPPPNVIAISNAVEEWRESEMRKIITRKKS
jgi:hypothetical protein